MGFKRRPHPGAGQLTEVWERHRGVTPSSERVRQAGALFRDASPAMVKHAALWLVIDDELQVAGMSDEAIVRAYADASETWPAGWAPSSAVVWPAFERWPDAAFAKEVCARSAADPDNSPLECMATMALAIRARAGEALGEADEKHITALAPWEAYREVIAALPVARRGPLVADSLWVPTWAGAARVQLERVLPLLDLCDGPELREALEKLCVYLEGEDSFPELVAEVRAGSPIERTADRAVEHVLGKQREDARAASIADVARQVDGRGFVEVAGVLELSGGTGWRACNDARRVEIARAVVAALDGEIEHTGFEEFGAGPIALFEHAGLELELALVPGGVVERGLSDGEIARIREAADGARGRPDWFEEFGQLLEPKALDTMRPVAAISVGPLLASRGPIETVAPAELTDWLIAAAPFRLPSEVEWEHLSRGGRRGELHWRRDQVPSNWLYIEIDNGGPKLSNPFGCWGFGLQPEVCADAWHPSYEGSPATSEPWWGPGDRAVRGGAAQLYPWQSCGEWQLMLNAMRTPAKAWPYAVSARPVIEIRCR